MSVVGFRVVHRRRSGPAVGLSEECEDLRQFLTRRAVLVCCPQQTIDVGGVEEGGELATVGGFDDRVGDPAVTLYRSCAASVVEPGEVAVDELAHPQVAEATGPVGGLGQVGKGLVGVTLVAEDRAVATAGATVGPGAETDSQLPHARPDLALGSAAAFAAGGCRSRHRLRPVKSEMVEPHTGTLFGTRQHTGPGRKGTMGELPGGTLHGAERAVDADQSCASGVPGAGPHLVVSLLADLGPEPLLARRHVTSLARVYRFWISGRISGRGDENRASVGHGSVLTCDFVECAPRDSNPEPAD